MNDETQILLKRTQCQNIFLSTSVYRKNRSKDNKILQNVRIEKSVQTVFAKTDRLMSKNFIQKFSRINEKHKPTRSLSVRDVDYESASIRSKSRVKRFQKITIRIIIENAVSMKTRNAFDAQRFAREISSFTRVNKKRSW